LDFCRDTQRAAGGIGCGLPRPGFEFIRANHYLRKGATGSNNGADWNNAWNECSSIQWSTVAPGDTLWIAGGTYTSALAVGSSGTAASRIMIKRVRTTDAGATAAAGWKFVVRFAGRGQRL